LFAFLVSLTTYVLPDGALGLMMVKRWRKAVEDTHSTGK
jgi:hypothetical protein